MNAILNLKNRFALPLMFAATAISAQNEIQYTQTDEKHGNTTVVYTKSANYNDMSILSQLDDSYGVGDVVRIAVAPPKPDPAQMVASNDAALMFATTQPAPKANYSVAKAAPQKTEFVKVAPLQQPLKVEEMPKKEVESVPVVKTPKQTASIGNKTVKKGSIFRLEKVYFDADKFELKSESEEELARLYTFLNDNPSVSIEVRGHTNNAMWPNVDFANELSSSRAKAVADWLVAKGIAANRIQHKGYGWTMPVEPNINAEGRKKNQRVEVKVLSM
jgi:outer membrane protein OmpA-like peptidoglycan-associated protein